MSLFLSFFVFLSKVCSIKYPFAPFFTSSSAFILGFQHKNKKGEIMEEMASLWSHQEVGRHYSFISLLKQINCCSDPCFQIIILIKHSYLLFLGVKILKLVYVMFDSDTIRFASSNIMLSSTQVKCISKPYKFQFTYNMPWFRQ